VMNNGKANAMDEYIFCHDHLALKRALSVAMPGVEFSNYKPVHLDQRVFKKDQCKDIIHEVVGSSEEDRISVKTINASLEGFNPSTKREALNELLADAFLYDWKKKGNEVFAT